MEREGAENQLGKQVGERERLTFWGQDRWDLGGMTEYLKQVSPRGGTKGAAMCTEQCWLGMVFTFSSGWKKIKRIIMFPDT